MNASVFNGNPSMIYLTPINFFKDVMFFLVRVIFLNSKLSFIPHIAMLKKKCTIAFGIIKLVANTKWGADKSTIHFSISASLSNPVPTRLRLYSIWSGKNVLH